MKNLHVDEIVSYMKQVGATEALIESIINESSRTWTFYWKGIRATLSTPGIGSSVVVTVFVPELPKYIGYKHCEDVTGRHFAKVNCVVDTINNAGLFAIEDRELNS